MQIVDHVLVRKTISRDQKVLLACQELQFTTYEQEILVWWKRGWHRMSTKTIGDGMYIAYFLERPHLTYHISPLWLVRGMSVYTSYDEDADRLQSYLYKFSSDPEDREDLQEILDMLAISIQLRQEKKYVAVDIAPAQFPQSPLQIQLGDDTNTNLYSKYISFLFGLFLAYGELDAEEGMLHGVRIYLPLVGSIVQSEEMVHQVLQGLQEHGIFVTHDVQNTQQGQQIQVIIQDWELLHQFALWLKPVYGDISVSKKDSIQKQKVSLLEFVQQETMASDVLEQLDYSVLKMLRK